MLKLHRSFSTLVSALYSPVSLLFPHDSRVIIKICLKPFNDFPISLKIKLNPLTWPNRPCETSSCLPTTWTLSLISHFSPSPRSLISLPWAWEAPICLGAFVFTNSSDWNALIPGLRGSGLAFFFPFPLKLSLNLLCQRGPSWTPNLSHYINSVTSTVCIKLSDILNFVLSSPSKEHKSQESNLFTAVSLAPGIMSCTQLVFHKFVELIRRNDVRCIHFLRKQVLPQLPDLIF